MITSAFANFPLFFYSLIVGVVAADGYPNQKFVLFRKLPDGRIKKVETFTEPISKEQAISLYGQDRYMLQSMKPRTKVIWKDLTISSEGGTGKDKIHLVELQPLERKTKYLTVGLVGLGVGTAVGFGATAVSLLNNNQLLNRAAIAIDSILAKYPILGFLCGKCAAPLVSVFDRFCNQCGYPITSPDRRQLAPPSEQGCPHCSFPARPGQVYCRECGKPLQNESSRKSWSVR